MQLTSPLFVLLYSVEIVFFPFQEILLLILICMVMLFCFFVHLILFDRHS